MSSSERPPSDWFSDPEQRELVECQGRLRRALGRDRASPSCGSPLGERLRYARSCSRTSRIASAACSDSSRRSGRMSSRSSADEWYSGNSPSRERVRQPTGRSKPGELNCRSSQPHGTKSSDSSAGDARTTCAPARSTSASPRRLRLYVSGPGSPTHAMTSPPTMLDSAPRSGEPRDRADRPRDEEEAIREPPRSLRQQSPQLGQERDAREVVVRERRVADVGREQNSSSVSPGKRSTRRTSASPARACCRSRRRTVPSSSRVELLVGRGRNPTCACSTTCGTGSSPGSRRATCRCGRSSSSVSVSRDGLAVADDVEVGIVRSRRLAARPAPRCTRRGCSTRPGPSSREPGFRSAPRAPRAGCVRRSPRESPGRRRR